jgi:uncharacterized protein (TIGR03435 family)
MSKPWMKAIKTADFAIVLLGITAISAHAQPAPAFEVASVKASPPRAGMAGFIAMDTDPAMVRYSNVTLKLLIAFAYRFDSPLVQGGPAWLEDQPYDLAAKLPAGTSKDRVPAMLQTLLVERFKLAVHRETTEQRVYFLVVGKNGPKLKAAEKADEQDVQQVRGDRLALQIVRGGIMGHSIAIGSFAGSLAPVVGYQVVDHTGLTGTFDIDFTWTPDDSKGTGPTLFTAIQEQLGLKLEPGKAPVEVLLVDHAERIPMEN